MADCGCCECTVFANYRGQRIAPNSSAEAFVEWVNTSRTFHQIERSSAVINYSEIGEQDAFGPDSLESDGQWVYQSREFNNPYRTFVYGGSMTLRSMWGSRHGINVVGGGPNFFNPLVVDYNGGTAVISAFGQTASLAVSTAPRTEGELAIGTSMSAFNQVYSTEAQYNAAKALTDINVSVLSYGTDSLRLLNTSQVELDAWVDVQASDAVTYSAFVTACGNVVQRTEYQFETLGIGAAKGSLNNPNLQYEGNPAFYLPDTVHPAEQNWQLFYGPYYNRSVYVRGEKVTLYRDGQVVLQAIRPTDQQGLDATANDGSYLLVSDVDESTNRPFLGEGIDYRRRWTRPFRQLHSFVVDRTPPVIGASAPQDFFIDEAGLQTVRAQVATVFATKPVRFTGVYAVTMELVSDGGDVVRPLPYGAAGLNGQMSGNVRAIWRNQEDLAYFSLPVGTHSVTPYVFYTFNLVPTFYPVSDFRDFATNPPSFTPTFTLQIHAVPANDRRGARPSLENVALQTREHYRPRLESEKVESVRLTFDRKVKADTVDVSQVTLTKNGDPVAGCEIEQASDTEWIITIPEQEQTSKAFFVLTYDPGGDVLTDDVTTVEYATESAFPPVESAQYKVVYVDLSTGDRYSKSPSGYVDIGTGPPIDEDGVPYDPEPSVLASRRSWLMASFDGWLEPENVASRNVLIGTRPSIGKAVTQPLADDGAFTISTTQGFAIGDFGYHARTIVADGFTPCVPLDTIAEGSPDDCGYWGLRTTIFPCTPRSVTDCACPQSHQRHASVIRSTDDITAIKVTIVKRDASGQEVPETPPANTHPTVTYRWGEVTCSRQFSGKTFCQNVWAGQIPSLSPTTVTDLLGTETLSILGGTMFVEAFRWVTEYAERKTGYLNELEFLIRFGYVNKRQFDPSDEEQEPPEDQYRLQWFYSRFAISRDQENALAAGQVIYVPWAEFAETAWWKLQKA